MSQQIILTPAMRKESVFIALPTTWERSGWIAPGLQNWLTRVMMTATRERRIRMQQFCRFPVDCARNEIVGEFIKSGLDWCLMIDTDQVPPMDLLSVLDLADSRMDVVVPKNFMLVGGDMLENFRMKIAWEALAGQSPDRKGWLELADAGTGVMAIRKSVFGSLQKPFFRFQYDSDGILSAGEDNAFCGTIRAANMRIFGNTLYECGHLKTVDLRLVWRCLREHCPS